jgi:hypothetical protein
MIVREALDHPEARLFQRLSKIMHHHNNAKSLKQQTLDGGDGLLRKLVRFCKRFACWKQKQIPVKNSNASSTTMLTKLEPPSDFMERFSEKFVFISDALPNESSCILLTILIFDQDDDMGDSRAAKTYSQLMRREFEPMKAAVRSIFSVVRDVMKAEQQAQIGQQWIVRTLKKQLLGREGKCCFFLLHFLSYSNRDLGEFFFDKGFVDFSRHEMYIPVTQLVQAQIQIVSKSGPIHRSRRKDLIADSRLALDTLSTDQSNSTRLLRRSNSVPNIQIPLEPPASQRNRPNMHAAKMMRAAIDASSHSASRADSNELLKLKIAELTEEAARVQSTEKENLLLKEVIEAKDRALMAKDK